MIYINNLNALTKCLFVCSLLRFDDSSNNGHENFNNFKAFSEKSTVCIMVWPLFSVY